MEEALRDALWLCIQHSKYNIAFGHASQGCAGFSKLANAHSAFNIQNPTSSPRRGWQAVGEELGEFPAFAGAGGFPREVGDAWVVLGDAMGEDL